ncbi:MAG TPA: dihydrofolate reductase family protein [Gemmatimonadaceae bacterium]
MKTQYLTACSLDGFIADPDDSLEWLFPLGNVEDTSIPEFMKSVGALAMGAHTYEWLLRNGFDPGNAAPQPWPYSQPTWVFTSRTLPVVRGADIRFVRGSVREVFPEIEVAAQGLNLWVMGGGDLAGQFFDAGLLDEIHVQFGSVTLGAGKPLFPRRLTSPPLVLRSVNQVGTGFAELVYEVPKGPQQSS